MKRKKSVGFKDRLLKLLVPFSVIAGVSSVLGFFGSFHYLVDFLANLRACFCLLFVMVALVAALLRDVRGTLICLAFLFINLATFVPFYINKPTVCPDKPQLRILSLNIFGKLNRNHEQTLQLVSSLNPDVVEISETTEPWSEVLRKKLPQYQ